MVIFLSTHGIAYMLFQHEFVFLHFSWCEFIFQHELQHELLQHGMHWWLIIGSFFLQLLCIFLCMGAWSSEG